MTDVPTTPGPGSGSDGPPFGDATDEAVSAFLDGELAGFAATRGLDPGKAHRQLEAWTGFAARRDELAAVRRALTESTSLPLDELTRRRLVATALVATALDTTALDTTGLDRLPSAKPARTRRGPLVAVAAVAAFLLAGTVAVVALRGGGSSSTAKGRGSAAAAEKAAKARGDTFVGSLGDVTDRAALRAALQRYGASAPGPSTGANALQSAPGAAPATGASDRAEAQRCARQLAAGRTSTGPVVLLAAATFQQRPALVVALIDHGRVVAFVLAPGTCDVLSSQSS